MEIPYSYYRFGPYLWQTKLPIELTDELLHRGRQSTVDHSKNLASVIDNVKVLAQSDREWLAESLIPYFKCYADTLMQQINYGKDDMVGMQLQTAWINFQKKHESNPEHVHNEDFSFVIYCQIPPEIKKAFSQYKGNGHGPGGITFRYGEVSSWTQTHQNFLPEAGDFFIFPASLAHWVTPFSCDGERISVSGNVKAIVKDDK